MGFLGRRKLMFSTGVALVVVAMVVVTVLVLSAGEDSAQASRDSHSRTQVSNRTAATSGCTRELFDDLAVLSRPQTAADRTFDPATARVSGINQGGPAKSEYALVRHLGRLARTLPNGSRVYLATYAPTTESPEALVGDMVYAFVAQAHGHDATFAGEESAPFLATAVRRPPMNVDHLLVEIVPNPVSAVRWTFRRERIPKVAGVSGAKVIPGGTVTANVVGNVAAAKRLPGAFGLPSVATWMAAGGRVIKTFHFAVPNFSSISTSRTVTATMTGTATPIGC
jgi:hypothetical protein